MPRQPEGRLAKSIRDYLVEEGAVVFNIHGGDNPFQEVGLPDLICCYRGRFIGLEVKVPRGKPSRRQESVLRKIRVAGGVGSVVSSVEEVASLLENA